jgi:hypothetical protein
LIPNILPEGGVGVAWRSSFWGTPSVLPQRRNALAAGERASEPRCGLARTPRDTRRETNAILRLNVLSEGLFCANIKTHAPNKKSLRERDFCAVQISGAKWRLSMSDGPFSKALQQQRKKAIEKLERDLTLLEAQQKEAEGLGDNEKAEGLRDGINGAKNVLDFLRVASERELPLQTWEEGGKR